MRRTLLNALPATARPGMGYLGSTRPGDSGEYVTLRQWWEVQMSEEDLELLVTIDDPGEDTLEEDTFHLQSDNMTGQPQQGGRPTSKQGHS